MYRLLHTQIYFIFTLAFLSAFSLSGCDSLPSSGPVTKNVEAASDSATLDNIAVIDIDKPVIDRLALSQKDMAFSETFKIDPPEEYRIGKGDMLEVTIWEAPPATLFMTTMDQVQFSLGMIEFPQQLVRNDGTIVIPFSGAVYVAGLTVSEVERDIVERLKKKAHQPQVLVRVARNVTANVKMLGEFTNNVPLPLTSKGEKLLDAVAAAGGLRQPVNKMTLQLARGSVVRAMPMEKVLEDPEQNVYLMPDDIVTALHQPLSLTMLGAISKNEEQDFETPGITLAQALARSGGLQDARADARGVFIFRHETRASAEPQPTIYRLDLKNPASIFLAQGFTMQDKDVIYISNAPSTDLAKFLELLGAATRAVAPPVTWSRWW